MFEKIRETYLSRAPSEKDAPLPAGAGDLLQRIARVRSEYRDLMEECVARGGADPGKFIDQGMPQSQLFMVEIIPFIHRYYFNQPVNVLKTALDIGPQTFAGTKLLHDIHKKESYSKLKLEITAVDIVDAFVHLRELILPEIEFMKRDIYSIEDRTWDFVICSHVIEHVPEPVRFLQKCRTLAKDFVIVACPWNENPITTTGHVNTIDKAFVRKVGGDDLHIYTNYSWGKDREVCIFRLPGKGR
jgi:SAM-dependent methyltransferase